MEVIELLRILLTNLWIESCTSFTKGFLYIEDNKVKDLGKQNPIEYELSDLVYDLKGEAVAYKGYSIAFTPTNYPFRGLTAETDKTVFSRNELKAFVKASFYEAVVNGITLPIVYGEHYIDIVVDVIKTYKLKSILFLDNEDLISEVRDYSGIYIVTTDKELHRKCNIPLIDPREICTLDIGVDAAGKPCRIVYNTFGWSLRSLSRYLGRSLDIKLLRSGYAIVGDVGIIGRNSYADIVVYDLFNVLNRPLILMDPLVNLRKLYYPSIVILNGEVVLEKDINYVFTEKDILNDMKITIINKSMV